MTNESLVAAGLGRQNHGCGSEGNDVGLTRVAERNTAIGTSRSVSSDVVAVTVDTTEERAASIEERSDDATDVGGVWGEHTAQRVLQACARSVIGGRWQRCRSNERRVLCWASRVGRGRGGTLAWAVGRGNEAVLLLEGIKVGVRRNGSIIRRDCNHSELTLTRCGWEIAECQATRPDVGHGAAEQRLSFCPETWWGGDAAEFTEVGSDVVTCEGAVLARVHTRGSITTPFTTRGQYAETRKRRENSH